MARSFFLTVFVLVMISCNNKNSDPVLSAPEYASINDSISKDPGNPELLYRRAVLLYSGNEKAYAEKDLRKAWNIEPKEAYALSLTTILRERSEDEAIRFLEEALEKLPNSIALKIGLARGYQKKKENAKALTICNDVLARYPGQLDALLLKAELLESENKTKESLETMAIAYAYAPGDADLVHNYAFALAEAKDPKVLALSDSLIRVDSAGTHAEPYYFKGLYFENIGNPAQALKLFDEAVKHDYYFLDAYMEKGQVLYNLKNYKQALLSFQLAATVTPTFADAYFWVAKCLEALGNKADAKTNYQRAYGLDKSMKEAREAADRL